MDEYISRLAVLRAVFNEGYVNELDLGYMPHNKAFREIIEQIPAADVRPVVRGEWVEIPPKPFVCSKCGKGVALFGIYVTPDDTWAFCPNCGADMRKEDDND